MTSLTEACEMYASRQKGIRDWFSCGESHQRVDGQSMGQGVLKAGGPG